MAGKIPQRHRPARRRLALQGRQGHRPASSGRVSDIDYLCESQLAGDAAVTGIHTHPAEPRTVRQTLRVPL